ncbi:transcriptional regulator GcvA [Bosea caraganae]|uniref:Transcriptional regulator GcvA n=1 Tax=Bosea caraganae TaxID=2763117 RepID=A0A370L6X0_9HYPH|nr:transcriptional regulator GcvA [Bosea caraganae]RDJ25507.1 transcriptional regulator GcvA [Bosea caraganae]RDJ25706.1 transcriptional regulator GcvA [Bosea caraganae]
MLLGDVRKGNGAMAPRLPPLNPLRAFEATARHLSVTKAANELYVTHSAISHQIRALETTLDVKLFYREGARLRLSAQGSALLPSISQAFETIAEATNRLRRTSMEGDLTISCVPALLSFWLLPRIATFSAQFPGIRLRVSSSNNPADVSSTAIDLCIHYGDGSWSGVWVRELTTINLFPVCSPRLLKTAHLHDVQDLAQQVILHGDAGREWSRWFAASGATNVLSQARQHFMSDANLAITAAMYGNGIALGDSVTVREPLASGRLVVPLDITVPATDAFFLICRNEIRSTPLVQAFIEWVDADLAGTELAEVRVALAERGGLHHGIVPAEAK